MADKSHTRNKLTIDEVFALESKHSASVGRTNDLKIVRGSTPGTINVTLTQMTLSAGGHKAGYSLPAGHSQLDQQSIPQSAVNLFAELSRRNLTWQLGLQDPSAPAVAHSSQE